MFLDAENMKFKNIQKTFIPYLVNQQFNQKEKFIEISNERGITMLFKYSFYD